MTPAADANDAELLRRFADAHSEEAFGELVRRHLDIVHSAALRQVGGNPAAAADVAQTVFTELAKQAGRLTRHPSPVGWLYTTTHRVASRHVRDETRRQRRELEAHAMQELLRENPPPDADWHRLQQVLDGAMHELGEADRLALLLRHFERRPFSEVGARLGLSENAARMRVDRALEKLRGRLAKSGITSTAAALALALSGSAVAAAPAGLASAVTTTAVATASLSLTTTSGLITLMASTKLKVAVGLTLFTAAVGPLLVHHRAYHHLIGENARLRNEVAALRELDQPAEPATAGSTPSSDPAELLQLRGAVAQLQREKAELAAQLKRASNATNRKRSGRSETAVFEPAQFSDVGAATPDDAAQSFMWALLNLNGARFAELMDANVTSGDGSPVDKAVEFAKIAQEMKSQLDGDGVRFGSLESVRQFSDRSAQASFGIDDSGTSGAFVLNLRRDGEVWKVQNIGKRSANEPTENPTAGQP